MDNNFNMYQQPKKKTGLIIGIIVAVVLMVAAIVTLVLVLGNGDDKENDYEAAKTVEIIGVWDSNEGYRFEFYEDNTGAMVYQVEDLDYEHSIPITWRKKGNMISIGFEDGTETENAEFTIVDVSETKLILEDESGEKYTFTKE